MRVELNTQTKYLYGKEKEGNKEEGKEVEGKEAPLVCCLCPLGYGYFFETASRKGGRFHLNNRNGSRFEVGLSNGVLEAVIW